MKTLFASDYDGTLSRLGYISLKTRRSIRKYRDGDHFFAAATGRCPLMFFDRSLGRYYDFIIGSTGARICDAERKVIYEKPLDKEDAEFVIEMARNSKARHLIAHLEDTYLFLRPSILTAATALLYRFINPNMVRKKLIPGEKLYQMSINLRSRQQVEEILEKCRGHNVNAFVNGLAVDIVHKDCSKSSGVAIVQKLINADKVYTIGDEKND